jgi:hypothetical protein
MDNLIFTIASHYASAIVNGDYSGLEDHEEQELDGFLDYLMREFNSNDLQLTDYYLQNEPDFNRCEISNLHSDCIQFNLIKAI